MQLRERRAATPANGYRILASAVFSVFAFGLVLAACDEFDGGLVPVTRVPPPKVTPDTTDTTSAPAVAITSPADGASVDADWIPVALDVSGFTFDATHGVAVTVIRAGAEPETTLLHDVSTVLTHVPAGAIAIRATLVEGTTPLEVFDEVAVTATRTVPTVTLTTPADGAIVSSSSGSFDAVVALTDFTLLADAAAPAGPREGRVSLAIDGAEVAASGSLTTSLSVPGRGAHTLTATLVDAAGAAWPGAAVATSQFTVGGGPAVVIASPAPDQVIDGARLTIVIEPTDFVTDGASNAGHGTFAVTLDSQLVVTKRSGTKATLNGLAAGQHTLMVELTSADGASLSPPVTASVAFESNLLPPGIDLVLPSGTTTKEGARLVAVLPHHFSFSSQPIPGPLVAATGGWQLLVDDQLAQDKLTQAQTTIVLAPGSRKLTARLIDTTGAPLSPAVEATRTIDVRAIASAVEILAPRAGATVAKSFTVAVGFEDFTLSSEILAPGQPVVPGVGHFHAFLRKVPDTTYEYQGFFLTETFQLSVADAGEYDLKVALHYQNHDPVQPAVEANVRFTVEGRSGIRVLSPIDSSRVGPEPFAVSVAVDNFELIPIGEVSTVRGHYHLFVDGAYQGFFLTPIAILDPKTMSPALAAGQHTLTAFLHNSLHEPIPGTLSDSVPFTFDPKPRVRILSPAAGTRVSKDPFEVAVAVDNFRMVDKAGQAPVAGEGHVHVFVDNAYIDFETSDRFDLAIDSSGTHTIKVTLHENDHTPIEGAAPAFVNVLVDPTPRVRFIAPSEGTFTYGGDIEVMLEAQNHAGDIELSVDDEVVYLGAPDAVVVPPLGEGSHTASVVPVDASGDAVVGSAVTTTHFEVVGLDPPTLTWVAPLPNATVVAGAPLTVGVVGFALEDGLGLRPAVPGDGLWTVSVGDRTFGPYAGSSATLPALPRGAATLVAELWHRDGSRVLPRRTASLPVTIGGTAPALSLRSPRPEGQWYGGLVELAVDVVDFTLSPTTGWLSIKVDGEQAAFVSRADASIGPFATGLHALEVELMGADQKSLAPPVTVTSSFRVGGATVPGLTISAPADGTLLSGDGVAVSFSIQDLAFDPAATGGRQQPGRGAVLVYVDGHVAAVATASPIAVSKLAPGRHRIELVLAGLDLVPVAPSVTKAIEVVAP